MRDRTSVVMGLHLLKNGGKLLSETALYSQETYRSGATSPGSAEKMCFCFVAEVDIKIHLDKPTVLAPYSMSFS